MSTIFNSIKPLQKLLFELLLTMVAFPGLTTQSQAAPGDPNIRILTIYNSDAIPRVRDPVFQTELEITSLNEAFYNSGIRLQAVNAGHRVFSPDKFAGVELNKNTYVLAARDEVGASIVILVWPSFSTSGALDLPAGSADKAFAYVSMYALRPVGRAYAHEIGHLLGARHQRTGGAPVNGVVFDDTTPGNNHGWYGRFNTQKQFGWAENWCIHTIMAYTPLNPLFGINCSEPSEDINYFSAGGRVSYTFTGIASHNHTASAKIGDASADNAQIIEAQGRLVAEFGSTKLLKPWIARFINIMTILNF